MRLKRFRRRRSISGAPTCHRVPFGRPAHSFERAKGRKTLRFPCTESSGTNEGRKSKYKIRLARKASASHVRRRVSQVSSARRAARATKKKGNCQQQRMRLILLDIYGSINLRLICFSVDLERRRSLNGIRNRDAERQRETKITNYNSINKCMPRISIASFLSSFGFYSHFMRKIMWFISAPQHRFSLPPAARRAPSPLSVCASARD